MRRFTALPTLLSLSALVSLAACSSGAKDAADTTAAVVTDTAAAVAEPAATSTPTGTDVKIVPININTATDAEILRIPGVGPRMLREFKEYRPYTSIEQFRREIGKYVDKAEVARLEQYIVIK
jgi:DNA uptake protein ComE-like DNA-binding protein